MLEKTKRIPFEEFKNLKKYLDKHKKLQEDIVNAYKPIIESAKNFNKNPSKISVEPELRESGFGGQSILTDDAEPVDAIGSIKLGRNSVRTISATEEHRGYGTEELKEVIMEIGYVDEIYIPWTEEELKERKKYGWSREQDKFSINPIKTLVYYEHRGFWIQDRRARYRPLDFKTLMSMRESYYEDFVDAILKDVANISYAGKDLLRELEMNEKLVFMTPYTVNDYLFNDNKVDFVRNKEGLLKENDIKRYPTLFASYLRYAKRYIMPRDFDKFRKFLEKTLNDNVFFYPTAREWYKLIGEYYEAKYKGYDCEALGLNKYFMLSLSRLAADYAMMQASLKKPISLELSLKSLKNEHDSISIEYRNLLLEKEYKGKEMVFDIPRKYRSVKISGYKALNNVFDFVNEGNSQNNCVASYVDRVKRGDCVVLSGETNGTHYTIEIALGRNNYFEINQMMAYSNRWAPKEDEAVVQKVINKLNSRRKFRGSQKELENYQERLEQRFKNEWEF